MDATDLNTTGSDRRGLTGIQPLAAAVALALIGTLGGCATHALPPNAGEVDRAKAAFARQDYAEAARLLSEPAMKGDAAAQYALGYLYYYGQGVPQDLFRARSWLETSAKLGNRDAKRALLTLATYGKLPRGAETQTATAKSTDPTPAQVKAAAEQAKASMPAMAPATTEPAAATQTETASKTDQPPASGEAPAATAAVAEPAPVNAAPAAPAADAASVVPATPAVPNPTVAPAAPPASAAQAAPAAVQPAAEVAAPARSEPPAVPAREPVPAPVDSTTARAGVIVAPMASSATPAVPKGEAAPAKPAEPAAAAKAPAQPPPANSDDSPDDVSSTPVVIVSDSRESAPAPETVAKPAVQAVALRRPAAADVSLVPGSEQAAPVIHKRPAPINKKRPAAAAAARPRYTIHLMSSPRREELLQTVRSFGLAQAAWYPVHQAGGVQYRLIYGGFESLPEARAAMHALPQPLYARNPWINNYPSSVTVTAFNGIPVARVAAVGRDILR